MVHHAIALLGKKVTLLRSTNCGFIISFFYCIANFSFPKFQRAQENGNKKDGGVYK